MQQSAIHAQDTRVTNAYNSILAQKPSLVGKELPAARRALTEEIQDLHRGRAASRSFS
jgi:hypothetical protein